MGHVAWCQFGLATEVGLGYSFSLRSSNLHIAAKTQYATKMCLPLTLKICIFFFNVFKRVVLASLCVSIYLQNLYLYLYEYIYMCIIFIYNIF